MMKAKHLLKLIPSHVRITKDVTYEVLFTDEFLGDDHQLGECRFETKQILIKNGLSPTETFCTYLHECLHSFSFEIKGLELTEKQVCLLEKGLFRSFKLNKILDRIDV